MTGTDQTTPPRRRTSPHTPYAASEAAKALALSIEDERRKLGELAFADLNSLAVIQRIQELERLINKYMLMTNANNAHRNIPQDDNCPSLLPRPSASGRPRK